MMPFNNYNLLTPQNKNIYQNKSQSSQKQRVNSQLQKQPPSQQKHLQSTNVYQTPLTHQRHVSHSSNFSQQSISQPKQKDQQTLILMEKLDNEFVKTLTDLESYYTKLTKHEQIRVEKWIVKIIQNDEAPRWKRNRNNYLKLLYHIVKNHSALLDPFDKMPDMSKDLPYMSDHEFGQRTKPRFDGKALIFHLHKPEMIKIEEPTGDNCSVLMSIINTARTQMTKENIVQQQKISKKSHKIQDEFKHSQLIEIGAGSMLRQGHKVFQTQRQNQEDGQMPRTTKSSMQRKNQLQVSSVIPSNLPSQVKSFTTTSKVNIPSPFNKNSQQQKQLQKSKVQKYNNHQKYSVGNSIIQSCVVNKNSLNQSSLQHQNHGSAGQLKVYKELVLTMGKLLLKHEFTIQRESEYWQLMRMIYSYQSSLRTSFTATPQQYTDTNRNMQNLEKSDRLNQNGNQDQDIQSFETFLNRLRQQVTDHTSSPFVKSKDISVNQPKQQEKQSPINQRQSPVNQRQSIINKKQSISNLRQSITQLSQSNKNFIYNQQETINHITEQSIDFKVEQGAQPSRMLYYELKSKRKLSNNFLNEKDDPTSPVIQQKLSNSQNMNNSIMQISDSYREIRRNLNPNILEEDYHNIYNELQPVEDEEICFTKQRLIEEELEETDQMYYKNTQQQQDDLDIEDFDRSPQFTDQEQEEDQQDGQFDDEDEQQDECHFGEQQPNSDEEEQHLMLSNSSQLIIN